MIFIKRIPELYFIKVFMFSEEGYRLFLSTLTKVELEIFLQDFEPPPL